MSFVYKKISKNTKDLPWKNTIVDTNASTNNGHSTAKNPILNTPPKETTKTKNETLIKFTVIGNRIAKEFIYCYYLVKGLHKYRPDQFITPVIRGVSGVEWPKVWSDLKIQYGTLVYGIISQVAVILNGKFLGGDKELKEFVESKYVYHLTLDYYKEGIQQLANYINSTGRPFAYMQFSINDKEIGTMIFMLYADIVPHTCDNFLRLCETTKGGYAGTPVHRIVKDCWIQCGGFGLKNSPGLPCENFIVPHDRRGVLCMANADRHVDCSTQFFVLLKPAPWMRHKYVAFGQLIEGDKTLQEIESVPTWHESPSRRIIIYKAGVFNMECQRMPINRNTAEYLAQHVEDYSMAGLLYEEILKNVFKEITRLEEESFAHKVVIAEENLESHFDLHGSEEESENRITQLHMNNGYGNSVSGATMNISNQSLNINEYEFGGNSRSTFVKPMKRYLPFTDVPYPGEVDSIFDLKKLMRGDYCLESDLIEPTIRKKKETPRIAPRQELLSALFETFTGKDEFDTASVDLDTDTLLEQYLRKNADTVSFAGTVVKEIQSKKNNFKSKSDILCDEELRLLRFASKEYQNKRDFIRRMGKETGLMRQTDLENLSDMLRPWTTLNDNEEDDLCRKVRITPMDENKTTTQEPTNTPPACNMHAPVCASPRYPLPITRFLETMKKTTDAVPPTFRSLMPPSNAQHKPLECLTYFKTGNTEDNIEKSFSTIDYAKKRPHMTVKDYQRKNYVYRKILQKYKTVRSDVR